MNNCILTGNLGSDQESIYTAEGTHIVNFPLAFRSGKDKTSWMRGPPIHEPKRGVKLGDTFG